MPWLKVNAPFSVHQLQLLHLNVQPQTPSVPTCPSSSPAPWGYSMLLLAWASPCSAMLAGFAQQSGQKLYTGKVSFGSKTLTLQPSLVDVSGSPQRRRWRKELQRLAPDLSQGWPRTGARRSGFSSYFSHLLKSSAVPDQPN